MVNLYKVIGKKTRNNICTPLCLNDNGINRMCSGNDRFTIHRFATLTPQNGRTLLTRMCMIVIHKPKGRKPEQQQT